MTSSLISKENLSLLLIGVLILGSSFYVTHAFVFNKSVHISEPVYAADFSNDKVLVGASHNIFVGKVLQQIGTKERGLGPETQFQVEVIDNIKGDLKGTVTLNQEGGYKNGVLYVVGDQNDVVNVSKENSYLLQPGSTYLFATRYNAEENWYTLNTYPTASKLLSNEDLNNLQLQSLAENDPRVQALKAAYPNEILIDADINSNKTYNNYKSIQEKVNQGNKTDEQQSLVN